MTTQTYTPRVHLSRPPHERRVVEQWLKGHGFEARDVAEVRLTNEGDHEYVEICTFDRDEDGKMVVIRGGGTARASQQVHRLAGVRKPGWWPTSGLL